MGYWTTVVSSQTQHQGVNTMMFGITVVVFLGFISLVAYVGLKDQFLADLASRKSQDEK